MGAKIPTTIDKFLGINENLDGETNLQLGESPNMVNWRITDNYKLKKVEGYVQLFASIAAKKIQGTWYGNLNGTYYFLFACNGHIYSHNLTTHANTDLGTLTDDITTFFASNNIAYIKNGHKYYKWTGTGVIAEVTGYRPLIAINCPPAGGIGTVDGDGLGRLYEEINLLNGTKHQTFNGNATATEYVLAEQGITSVDFVKVNGVLKTVTTDYTVNLTTGKVSPATPSSFTVGTGNVDIGWTKGTTTGDIEAQYYSMFFGGANDTRLFVWGRDNRYYYSGLAAGVPSVEYFPANSYNDVGTNQFKITDITRQYDRQIIFTNQPSAYFSSYETITDALGNVIADFPVSSLNSAKGMIAPNQTRVINNNPFSISDGVYNWVATNVRDERNAMYISKRVQPSVGAADLTKAITVDWEYKGEYWLCVGKTVWVYQYQVDVWFKLLLNDTPTCFIIIDNKLYFGTDNGQIMRFSDELRAFNEVEIDYTWEMGFYAVGYEWLRKFTNKSFISLKPEVRSRVKVYWETDKDEINSIPVEIYYNNADFDDTDFDDYTFLGNYNPQPFPIKNKAKKWTYFKMILKDTTDRYTATIISINLLDRIGGEVKG